MTRLIALYVLGAAIVSCDSNKQQNSIQQTQDSKIDSIAKEINRKRKSKRPTIGLIVSSENIKVYGDTTTDKNIHLLSIKFEPYISFQDFKVIDTNKFHKAEIDFKSNPGAFSFRTRIRSAYSSDTANFAGHYTFAFWGCGAPCQSGVIIDRKTGKIYDAPASSLGYDFRADSRMLITNPPDSTGFYEDCVYCKPRIFLWDDERFNFVERNPK